MTEGVTSRGIPFDGRSLDLGGNVVPSIEWSSSTIGSLLARLMGTGGLA
jgi:hypothetical protein